MHQGIPIFPWFTRIFPPNFQENSDLKTSNCSTSKWLWEEEYLPIHSWGFNWALEKPEDQYTNKTMQLWLEGHGDAMIIQYHLSQSIITYAACKKNIHIPGTQMTLF